MKSCAASIKINMVVLQKIGNQSTSRCSYTTLEHILQGHFILLPEHLLSHVHCRFIHNSNLKQSKYPSVEELIRKYATFTQWIVHTIQSLSKDIMKFVSKGMEFEKRIIV